MEKAAWLYEEFTGHPAKVVDVIDYDFPREGLTVGKILGVIYETTRDGEKADYIHRFKKSAQPLLAVSYDGRTFFSVGGNFRFTNAGFVDD